MALSLSDGTTTLTLPQNLLWADELAWDPVQQSTAYTLTGALVVEEAQAQAGRPITYSGGLQWAPLARSALLALLALGAAGRVLTLTHHDGRTFRVVPRRGSGAGDCWLHSVPWPVVGDSGPADPSAAAWYAIEELRLIEVPV